MAAAPAAQTAAAPPVRIAPPDSAEEREADRIADAVIRGASVAAPNAPSGPREIHRKCTACSAGGPPCAYCAEEAEDTLKLKRTGIATASVVNARSAQAAVTGGGRPLPYATRRYFEPRFNADLSHVRLHTDAAAARSAAGIGARAYALRDHIAFAPGEFRPETTRGRRLVAHELAHVLQGRPATLYRDDEDGGAETEAAPPMSRAEEIALSRSTPGVVTATLRPFRVVLENFVIDSSALKDEHRAAIAELRSLLAASEPGAIQLVIVGHADESGDTLYNSGLSVRRARAVRRALDGSAVASIVGFGESAPADPANTVEARSRNRRVEIQLLPGPRPPPPIPVEDDTTDPVHDPEPTQDPPPETDDRWFCDRYPLICAALLAGGGIAVGEILRRLLRQALRSVLANLLRGGIGAAFAALVKALGGLSGAIAAAIGAAVAYCLANPAACLPDTGGPPDGDDPERDEDEPPERHACVDHVDLPSGELPRARLEGGPAYYFLERRFTMSIRFRDDPESGCDCSCGEYLQMVSGTFEKNEGSGWARLPAPRTADGSQVHPTRPKEDARHGDLPYGHRFADAGRTRPRDPEDFDQFLPDMENGCLYSGSDRPGIRSGANPAPGTEFRFHVEFSGVPVDGCAGRRPLSRHLQQWTIDGYGRIPEPEREEEDGGEPPAVEQPESTDVPPDTPREEGPSIRPAPEDVEPVPTDPHAFCLDDNIACITAEYIQDRNMVLSQDELEHAVLLEFRALRHRCRAFRWRSTTMQPDRPLTWDGYVRSQAERRVRAFWARGAGIRDLDLGPICPWR